MPALTGPAGGRPSRGFTLPELVVALALAALVGGAIANLLVRQQRLHAATRAAIAGRQQVAHALTLLAGAVRGASARGGDLTALAADSVQLRATIGATVACAVRGGTAVDLPSLHDSGSAALAAWSSPPRAGDTLVVYDPGDSARTEAWSVHAVVAVEGGGEGCSGRALSGAPGARLVVDPATPLPATAGPGSALRVLRHVRYKLYRAGDGGWYLGFSDYRAGTGWATVQPVSGPYAPPSAAAPLLRFFDAAGAAVDDTRRAEVALVRIVARAAPAPNRMRGDLPAAVDSVDVALRNAQD